MPFEHAMIIIRYVPSLPVFPSARGVRPVRTRTAAHRMKGGVSRTGRRLTVGSEEQGGELSWGRVRCVPKLRPGENDGGDGARWGRVAGRERKLPSHVPCRPKARSSLKTGPYVTPSLTSPLSHELPTPGDTRVTRCGLGALQYVCESQQHSRENRKAKSGDFFFSFTHS